MPEKTAEVLRMLEEIDYLHEMLRQNSLNPFQDRVYNDTFPQ